MNDGEKITYNKVLFADLDGTLITTLSGKEFPEGCYDMKPRLDTFEAIKKYNPDLVVIISNQGGIEAGFVNPNFFHNKIMWVASIVAEYCGCDCRVEYCPTLSPKDKRRKPNAGMIFDALSSTTYDSHTTFLMIGDRKEDEQCAANAIISYCNVEDFNDMYNKN